jgi:DNA-binding MarR family transcriptional regulator
VKQEPSVASFAYELLSASGRVAERLEAALEPLGLSLAKFGALSKLVAAEEPLPLSTLAERCACVRSNITQLVDRLEADGLVSRSDDPHDRRSIRAALTDEGRRRQAAGLRAVERAERDLLAHLPKPKQDSLVELLRSLHTPSS